LDVVRKIGGGYDKIDTLVGLLIYNMVSNNYKSEKYKPGKIKFLLIAEAPGSLDTFFYNEKVNKYVALYSEIREVVCHKCHKNEPKSVFLEDF